MKENELKIKTANITENKRKNRESSLKSRRKKEGIEGYIFMAPFLISALLFLIGPLLVAFMLSFKQYSLLDSTSMFNAKWVGLNNYMDAFKDPSFKKALINTTVYASGVTPIQLLIALLLALVVDGKVKGKAFFRTAYYIPNITSTVAAAVMFLFVFKTDGLLNKFLGAFGIHALNFFSNPKLALPSIMAMAVWSSVGLYMVIFLAGLQDIPTALYEAASIDGCNKFQSFWNITLPLLRPTIFFNLVVSLIGTFQMFDQSFVISNGTGGPMDSTMTVLLYLYRQGFREFKMGYACAIAFILFVIIFALTMIQKKVFGEETSM